MGGGKRRHRFSRMLCLLCVICACLLCGKESEEGRWFRSLDEGQLATNTVAASTLEGKALDEGIFANLATAKDMETGRMTNDKMPAAKEKEPAEELEKFSAMANQTETTTGAAAENQTESTTGVATHQTDATTESVAVNQMATMGVPSDCQESTVPIASEDGMETTPVILEKSESTAIPIAMDGATPGEELISSLDEPDSVATLAPVNGAASGDEPTSPADETDSAATSVFVDEAGSMVDSTTPVDITDSASTPASVDGTVSGDAPTSLVHEPVTTTEPAPVHTSIPTTGHTPVGTSIPTAVPARAARPTPTGHPEPSEAPSSLLLGKIRRLQGKGKGNRGMDQDEETLAKDSLLMDGGTETTESVLAVPDSWVKVIFEGTSGMHKKYFKTTRTATIKVFSTLQKTGDIVIVVTRDGNVCPLGEPGSGEAVTASKWTKNSEGSVRKVTFSGDGEYTLCLKDRQTGKKNIVRDRTGREGLVVYEGAAPEAFVIDKCAPKVTGIKTYRMDGEVEKWKHVYTDTASAYYASALRVVLAIEDSHLDPAEFSATVLSDGRLVRGSLERTAKGLRAVFSLSENHCYSEFKVSGRDLAGNLLQLSPTYQQNGGEDALKKSAEGTITLIFGKIIDTEAPMVKRVATRTTKGNTARREEAILYEDTEKAYYNEPMTVYVRIEEKNLDISGVQMVAVVDESTKKARGDVSATQEGALAKLSLEADHTYTEISVTCRDRAGNLLAFSNSYGEEKEEAETLVMDETHDGRVMFAYGKVIDTQPPVICLSYSSKARANLYPNETEGKVSAYYRRNIKITADFSDNEELDGSRLFAGFAGKEEPLARVHGKRVERSCLLREDGRYIYTAYGRDRAGNVARVVEQVPRTTADRELRFEKAVTKDIFSPRYELVLDKTAPTFQLSITSPKASNNMLSANGNRYYFNQPAEVAVLVQDANYDAARIGILRGAVTNGSYDSSSLMLGNDSLCERLGETARGEYRETLSVDGVYRYGIFGSDKAGNALIPLEVGSVAKLLYLPEAAQRTMTNLDGVSGQVRKLGSRVGVEMEGTGELQADLSCHIVLDRIKPMGLYVVQHGQERYYAMNTSGNVTLLTTPFRAETEAEAVLLVDASREHSPLKCEFAVDSTIPENTRNHVDADYRYYGAERSTAEGSDTEPSYACMHSLRLQGAQKFRLKNWKLTDLAGNTTICTPSHTVFLDTDVPEDELSPAIKVAASVPEATRDGHGQDLFSGDVPVLINVRDPDGKTSSSGLGEIRYTLFMDGAVVREEILRHNPLLSQSNVAYEDLALATDWSGQVQVPSGVCNHNDLVLEVVAKDNAGHESSARYEFAIDVTAPIIEVAFDNNDAQNEKYFPKPRTARIRVTERNFDPARIQIATNGSIGGWARLSSAAGADGGRTRYGFGADANSSQGGSDRGTDGESGRSSFSGENGFPSGEAAALMNSANGDSDVWTCLVYFAEDAAYTLAVSGEDRAGNPAKPTLYYGTAPWEFVIDQTPPAVKMIFAGGEVQNGKYCRTDRKLSIHVEDSNFAGESDVSVTAGEGGIAPQLTFAGNEATLAFSSEGSYALSGTVTDLAGNVSETFTVEEFVIDKTAPEVRIEGVDDLSANRTSPTIVLSMRDSHFSVDDFSTFLVGKKSGTMEIVPREAGTGSALDEERENSAQERENAAQEGENAAQSRQLCEKHYEILRFAQNDKSFLGKATSFYEFNRTDGNDTSEQSEGMLQGTLKEFEGTLYKKEGEVLVRIPTNLEDDYYKLIFTATDLAGNQSSLTRSFSVNQKGTVFVFEQEELENQYVREPVQPSFQLFNVDEVTVLSVTVNGQETPYIYENGRLSLAEELARDGRYDISITTLDSAGNTNTMEPVEFVVDRTAPVLTVDGLSEEEPCHFSPFEIILYKDKEEDVFEGIEMDGRTLTTEEYSTRADGSIVVPITEYAEHVLLVRAVDAAGNSAEKTLAFSLTQNPWVRFYDNKPLFVGSLTAAAIGVALLVFLLIRRRRR